MIVNGMCESNEISADQRGKELFLLLEVEDDHPRAAARDEMVFA